jgi:hypothetical protein
VRLERHDGYWLLIGPAAPGASATTLGPLILMRRRAVGNQRLRRHELEHVRQWREHGVVGFARRYLRAYLSWRLRGYPHWAAYRRVPLEIEAEWTARRAMAADPQPSGSSGTGGRSARPLRAAGRPRRSDRARRRRERRG